MAQSPKLIVLDLTNLAWRSYHSLAYGESVKPDTDDIALDAFRRILFLLIRYPAAGAIGTLDGVRPYWREALLPVHTYKAGRKYEVEDVKLCIEALGKLRWTLQRFGVPVFVQDFVEADDIMAMVAHKFGYSRTVVYSGDKDLWQLAAFGATIVDDMRTVSPRRIHPMKGVPLNGWLLYRALVGDSSDRIDGVRGVGHVTAMNVSKFLKSAGLLEDPVVTPKRACELLKELVDLPAFFNLKPRAGVTKLLSNMDKTCSIVSRNIRVMRLPNAMCPFDTNKALEGFAQQEKIEINKRELHSVASKLASSVQLSDMMYGTVLRQNRLVDNVKRLYGG